MREIHFKALGTYISIRLFEEELYGRQVEMEKLLKNFYFQKEGIFSRFDKKSELSRLNSSLLKFNPASYDIIETARHSLKYYEKSRGYFDPRIIEKLESVGYETSFDKIISEEAVKLQSDKSEEIKSSLRDDLAIRDLKICFGRRMDFSGLAKGYITDKAAEMLAEKGFRNFLVDSGGDMRVLGRDQSGENWKISLEGVSEGSLLFELSDGFRGIATSGISRRKWQIGLRRFHHLINPKKLDEFNFDLKSVTVVAKSAEEADVWAKVLFLMGKKEGLEFSEEKNIRSLFLDYRGNAYVSSAIKNNLKL